MFGEGVIGIAALAKCIIQTSTQICLCIPVDRRRAGDSLQESGGQHVPKVPRPHEHILTDSRAMSFHFEVLEEKVAGGPVDQRALRL